MGHKVLAYVGLGVVLLFLIGTFAMGGRGMSGKSVSNTDDMAGHHGGGQVVGNMDGHHGGGEQFIISSEELAKYRSEDIPADCRLPDYENDLDSWKEHLGHHENTLYCLDYYELEGGGK